MQLEGVRAEQVERTVTSLFCDTISCLIYILDQSRKQHRLLKKFKSKKDSVSDETRFTLSNSFLLTCYLLSNVLYA